MAKHHLTHAGQLFYGGGYVAAKQAANGRKGVPIHTAIVVNLGQPDTADPDGAATSQAVAGAGNLTLDGALASGGVVTFDVPRNVVIDSDNAGDTTQTATITGTDENGITLVETLTFNGTTQVPGAKAFKTITQIAISAALTGNAFAGSGVVLGLPYFLGEIAYMTHLAADGADELATSTVVAGVTTTATATTGDVRGTVSPATAPDGSVEFIAVMFMVDAGTTDQCFGVAQFGG